MDGGRETTTLPVVSPAIERDEVDSPGRVGAVAYPYRAFEASVTIDPPLVAPRTDRYVVSVDRSRRLALRADEFPAIEERTLEDVLVLPIEVGDDATRELARDAVFNWTLRRYSLGSTPDVEFERATDAYKVFWLAERDDGDVLVDSVRGGEERLDD